MDTPLRCKDAILSPSMADVWQATQGIIDQAEQDGAEHLALQDSPYLDECVKHVHQWGLTHRLLMRSAMDARHELDAPRLAAPRRRHLIDVERVVMISLAKAAACGLTYAGMVAGYVFRQQEEQAEVQSFLSAVGSVQ